MVKNVSSLNITNHPNFLLKDLKRIPKLDFRYATEESRANTIAVLGSSSTDADILKYMDLCSEVTGELVKRNYNILTGNGAYGIMGAAYDAAAANSIRDIQTKKPIQNLVILRTPFWGDERTDCIPIGKATSENLRIDSFSKTADTFLCFDGGPATVQEVTSLIAKNHYGEFNPVKNVILVGREAFMGLINHYQRLFGLGRTSKCPEGNLFSVAETKDEILGIIRKFSKSV